jgi:allophanate hydrolase
MKLCESGPSALSTPKGSLSLILFGAHMKGLPLNSQVIELGGQFVSTVKTAPLYRMFHLPDPPPQRPGLIRVAEGGESIEGEEWEFPVESIGSFLAKIKQPLGLGEIELADGRKCHGFLSEQAATFSAIDISRFQDWRSFMASSK